MSVTAALVKELREKSGAGMMDCKKALGETDGDMDAAIDWLRTKGLAAAAKKSGRVAAEGLVGIAVAGSKGAVVELNAETDFVARNSEFQAFASALANLALNVTDIEALKGLDFPGTGRNVADELTQKIATIGENMSLRRMQTLEVSNGAVGLTCIMQPLMALAGLVCLLLWNQPLMRLHWLRLASRLRCILQQRHLPAYRSKIWMLTLLPVSAMF